MSEFKVIETQEQLDELMKPRLTRASETARKKAIEELQPQLEEAKGLKERVSTLESTIKENDGKIKDLETQLAESKKTAKEFEVKALRSQVIMENKLPIEFAERLKGETAEELQSDAETLSQLLKTNKSYMGLPLANNADKTVDAKEAGYTKLLDGLKGE